jgi:hypothetical protein
VPEENIEGMMEKIMDIFLEHYPPKMSDKNGRT